MISYIQATWRAIGRTYANQNLKYSVQTPTSDKCCKIGGIITSGITVCDASSNTYKYTCRIGVSGLALAGKEYLIIYILDHINCFALAEQTYLIIVLQK